MKINRDKIAKIKELIDRHHQFLLIGVLGRGGSLPLELREILEKEGVSAPEGSALRKIYLYNLQHVHTDPRRPMTWKGGQKTMYGTPLDPAGQASVDHLETNLEHLIDKQRAEVLSRVETMIQESNREYRLGTLGSTDEDLQRQMRDGSRSELKTKLKDLSHDGNRSWERIVNTEMSNAIGAASVDRLVEDNENVDPAEIYVYRISKLDGALCRKCREFYVDEDGSPKLYTLAALEGNGSNFGKKMNEWLPVTGATHPHCRESQVIQLHPGWKLLPGGTQSFVGAKGWGAYLKSKIQS